MSCEWAKCRFPEHNRQTIVLCWWDVNASLGVRSNSDRGLAKLPFLEPAWPWYCNRYLLCYKTKKVEIKINCYWNYCLGLLDGQIKRHPTSWQYSLINYLGRKTLAKKKMRLVTFSIKYLWTLLYKWFKLYWRNDLVLSDVFCFYNW